MMFLSIPCRSNSVVLFLFSCCSQIRLLHLPPMDPEHAKDPTAHVKIPKHYNKNDGLFLFCFEINIFLFMVLSSVKQVKQVKKLNEMLPVLDIEVMLLELDRFLLNYASFSSNGEVLDLPNRIVKTIVSSIVRHKVFEPSLCSVFSNTFFVVTL